MKAATRRRLFFRLAVALLALAAWVTAEIAPALADDGPALVVSSDGTHWGGDLAAPLFDPSVLWVPGDARTSSFYVQNRGTTPASVRMEVRTDDGDLVAGRDVVLLARVGSEAWHPVVATAAGVLNTVAIGVHRAQRVDVRAVFRKGSSDASQASAVGLHFVVNLAESVTAPPGSLPSTGAPALGLPTLLGCVLLGAGTALVRRRRVA